MIGHAGFLLSGVHSQKYRLSYVEETGNTYRYTHRRPNLVTLVYCGYTYVSNIFCHLRWRGTNCTLFVSCSESPSRKKMEKWFHQYFISVLETIAPGFEVYESHCSYLGPRPYNLTKIVNYEAWSRIFLWLICLEINLRNFSLTFLHTKFIYMYSIQYIQEC